MILCKEVKMSKCKLKKKLKKWKAYAKHLEKENDGLFKKLQKERLI